MKKVEGWPVLLFAGWLIASPVWAQDPPAGKKETNSGSAPSLEFLEYLGEFETDEGEWVDPEELEQMESMDEADKKSGSKGKHD